MSPADCPIKEGTGHHRIRTIECPQPPKEKVDSESWLWSFRKGISVRSPIRFLVQEHPQLLRSRNDLHILSSNAQTGCRYGLDCLKCPIIYFVLAVFRRRLFLPHYSLKMFSIRFSILSILYACYNSCVILVFLDVSIHESEVCCVQCKRKWC